MKSSGNRLFQLFSEYKFALLSGILLIVIQPPVSLWPLAFCALVPLFRAIDKDNLKRSFLQGLVAGIVTWLGTIYWVVVAMNQYGGIIVPLSILILLLFVLYLSLYMGVFTLTCAFLEKRVSLPSYLSAPAIWVILEYARGIVMTGFPWSYLAHSQYGFLPLIQVTSVTGTFFISFLIVAVNAIIYSLWIRRKVSTVYASIILVLFGLSFGYGFTRMSHKDTARLKTAIVQGNIGQDIKWDESFKAMTVSKYYRLSFGLAQDTDLIIWPETAIPFLVDRDVAAYQYIRAVPRELKSRLLFGTIALERAGGLF
ncbi:MAG: apolipoprotein N-acyltransferase, partial [Syntrophorhabdus sp.]